MASIKNIYKEDIDFAELAKQDEDFAKVQLDFSNPESVEQLTKSLLKRDFGLQISLPPDRLCPPVPNRLNYILWIQALLDSTSDSYTDSYDPSRDVLGLDIGTGASCIYPLLGCSQRPKWRFAGTGMFPPSQLLHLRLIIPIDIDEKSFQFAQQNIQANGLQNRVKLLQTKPDYPLLPLDKLGFEGLDFSMCNPPFYTSPTDLLTSAASKQRPPNTACTGSAIEMVTPGGEVAFITRMINESLILKDRIQWYTSMCGKLSSISSLIEIVKEKGIRNYAVTEFVQGSRTRRWGIAWSFQDLRPSVEVARGLGSLPKGLLPFPVEYVLTLGPNITKEAVAQRLNSTLSSLTLKWMWRASISIGLGFAERNVWSRASRRQVPGQDEAMEGEDADEPEMALGFKVSLEDIRDDKGEVKVTIRWLKGHDSVLFESLCGMLKRKMGA